MAHSWSGWAGGAGQCLLDKREEFVSGEGLLDEDRIGGAGGEFGRAFSAVAADEDDGQAGPAVEDTAAEFDAGLAGHHDIADDEVGAAFVKDRPGLRSIRGLPDIVALGTKETGEHDPHGIVIVNDKDGGSQRSHHLDPMGRGAKGRKFQGDTASMQTSTPGSDVPKG